MNLDWYPGQHVECICDDPWLDANGVVSSKPMPKKGERYIVTDAEYISAATAAPFPGSVYIHIVGFELGFHVGAFRPIESKYMGDLRMLQNPTPKEVKRFREQEKHLEPV